MAAFTSLLSPVLALTPLRAPLSGAGTPLLALTPLRSLHAPLLYRAGKPTAQLRDIFGEKPAVQTWPSDPSITYTDYGLVSRELYDSGDLTPRKIAEMVPVERGGVDRRLQILHGKLAAMQPFE